MPGTPPPDWLRRAVEPAELEADYAALLAALSTLDAELPDADRLSALDVAVLRCLIVHNWRRLVLKNPPLPLILTDPDGPARQSHLMVADLLARFPRPSLRDLTT